MKSVELRKIEKTYIDCPSCGAEAITQIDHLFEGYYPRRFGPWYCDSCGVSYSGNVLSENRVKVEVDSTRRRDFCIDILCREGVYLFVKGRIFDGLEIGSEEMFGNKTYFYESHTCPVNYLGVEEVYLDGEGFDPHGIFTYVGTLPWPTDDRGQPADNLDAYLHSIDIKQLLDIK